MTEKDRKLLAEFEIRMRQLMYFCDVLRDENIRLKQQIAQKDTVIDTLVLEVQEIKTKYDNLRFVKSFSSGSKDEIAQAKNKLRELVRDVDKCIAMLKK